MFQKQFDDVDVATVGGSVQSSGATMCLRIGTGAMIQEKLTHRLVSCPTGIVLKHKSVAFQIQQCHTSGHLQEQHLFKVD